MTLYPDGRSVVRFIMGMAFGHEATQVMQPDENIVGSFILKMF